MNISAHFRMRPRTIVLAVAAVILAWLVVSRSLAAFLAGAAPQAALWISPRQPEALVTLADQALNASVSTAGSSVGVADQTPDQQKNVPDSSTNAANEAGTYSEHLNRAFEVIDQNRSVDLPTVRAWAESALTEDPLNARALRILGQAADAAKDDADTSRFMQAAAHLSLHESVAVYWLMRRAAQGRDYKSAIYYGDALLRTRPELEAYVAPVFAHISEDNDGAALVKTVLAGNPPWRRNFIAALPNSVTDARTPLNLLLALRANPLPLMPEDIEPYIDALIAHKFYGLAYYTWLQFLPPEELSHAGLLFNGSFEVAPSGLPFDWKITPGAGVTIDIVPRSDKSGEHALLVDFQYGRVDYHSVTELVMLAPGTYEFTGAYKGQLVGPRGLKWRIVCANGTITSGGESPMITGVTKDWKNVAFTFTVPAKDCGAQFVRLDLDARMASEQLISGSILFDELQISRVANLPTSGG